MSNPGRRAPVDFPDRSGLSAGTPGQDDLKKGLAPVKWAGEGPGQKGTGIGGEFEGSFTTQDSAGRSNGRQAPPQKP